MSETAPPRPHGHRAIHHAASALVVLLALALGACSRGPSPAPPGPTPSPSGVFGRPLPTHAPLPGVVRLAAVGDIGNGSREQRGVAEAIARRHAAEPVDLLLLLGDLIYPHGNPAQYQQKFAEPYSSVLEAGIETRAVLGNHDIRTDPESIMRRFGMPGRYYTLIRGPVQLFALDTSRGLADPAQATWLEGELQRSRTAWKVAFMHVPLFSSGVHGSSSILQQALAGLFARYGVQLALAGHDHNYERTVPIGRTTYIVSGGGCCVRKVQAGTFSARAASGLHFVTVEFSADSMEIEAIDAQGRVLDRAVIARAPAPALPVP